MQLTQPSWIKRWFADCIRAGSVLAVLLGTGGRGLGATNDAVTAEYLVEAWNSDRGLPQNTVVSLAQTPDGYLWIGTLQAGIARFDGVRFVSFDPANTPELKQFEIRRLTTDSQGRLWIAMVGGQLARFEAGKFTVESNLPLSKKEIVRDILLAHTNEVFISTFGGALLRGAIRPATNSIWERIGLANQPQPRQRSCCASSDGRIWYVRAGRRLGCWHDDQIESGQPYAGLPGKFAAVLVSDAEKRLWVGTEAGFAVWQHGAFENMTPTNGEAAVDVQALAIAGDGGQWVRTEGRLRKSYGRRWTVEAKQWRELVLPGEAGSTWMHGDNEGGLWVIHEHGLDGIWHIQPSGEVRHLTSENGLPHGQVNCWLQDSEGNVWLGLEGGGLVRVRRRHFQVLRLTDEAAGAMVRSVCEDQEGGIWLGGADGRISRWFKGGFEELRLRGGPLPAYDVTLWPDRQGGLWAGTVQNGVWLWREGRAERPFAAGDIGAVVRVLFEDRAGQMWFGNEFGLFCWRAGRLKKFGRADGFEDEYVLSLAEDLSGALWVGTAGGRLWRFQDGKFEKFTLPSPAPEFRLWALLPDADGTVWVGTLGEGLLRWREGKLARCTARDGLPSDTISQLLCDRQGQVWCGSRAGIFSVSREELNAFFDGAAKSVSCRVFGVSDGLPALECSGGFQPSGWRGRGGRLWFATVKGAVSVQPSQLPKNALPPPVVIEEMRVDALAQDIGRPNEMLRIQPGRHYVEFGFTGVSLTAPERVRFQWQLEGLEQNWVEGGSRRMVSYSFLPPGDYTFRVRACNNDGVWNETGASLGFTVLPHVWERWWFRLMAPFVTFALAGGGTLVVIRRRHRLQLERVEHQRALERERARIAQDLHDDLGASLTQVLWLGEAASRGDAPADHRQALVSQITEASRDMVRAIDEIVWAVNPKNDSLDDLITYVCQFAEQLFRGTATRCWLSVPESLPAYALPSDVRHNLFLIAKEALHNVAKHAQASQVWVRVKLEGNVAQFLIEDNGRGFEPAGKSEGDGFQNMHQRAKAIGIDFTLRSAPGGGTTVTWMLPLDPDRG